MPFVIYKCVTCGPRVAASYHPSITPMVKHPHFVISSYEPYGWRTCILSSPGTSPDTWPGEFQFTGSPRTSVLDFVTSEVDRVVWTRPTRSIVFNLPLFMLARENHFEDKQKEFIILRTRKIRGFSISKISLTIVGFSSIPYFILFAILILVSTNIYSFKRALLLISIIFIYI